MKRLAMIALVLMFGISCDDSPTSPSDPNVKRFSAVLLPSNEVPAITNADAAASGTMLLTMTVTRDAANAITGAAKSVEKTADKIGTAADKAGDAIENTVK